MNNVINRPLNFLAGLFLSTSVVASPATIPNTFVSGTPARAAEVNANFAAVKAAVDDNAAQISQLISHQPAQVYQTIVFLAGETVHRELILTVPSGKRLVVEYISVNYLTTDRNVNTRSIIEVSDIPGSCPLNPKMRQVLSAPQTTYVSDTELNTIVSQSIRLYAEAGEQLCMHLNRSGDVVDRDVGVHLTGYYVDVP